MKRLKKTIFALLILSVFNTGCDISNSEPKPRLSLFIGVDISGSFMNSGYYEDAINFLARYIYGHLYGLGGLEEPNVLFVGSIGGAKADEAKTFYPIHTFQGKSVEEIDSTLWAIFPRKKSNPFTDYNAFFEQIAMTVKNKNLVLRPISVVMVSDGIPDVKKDGETDFRSIDVKPLENLARNVTVRLLYTSAEVGKSWQTKVKRQRVKIWTQDAKVMESWNDPNILFPDSTFEQQDKFFAWTKDNVDFGVRSRRVD